MSDFPLLFQVQRGISLLISGWRWKNLVSKNRFVELSRSSFILMSRFCQPRNYLSDPGLLITPFVQFWEKHPKFKLLEGIPACSSSYPWLIGSPAKRGEAAGCSEQADTCVLSYSGLWWGYKSVMWFKGVRWYESVMWGCIMMVLDNGVLHSNSLPGKELCGSAPCWLCTIRDAKQMKGP